MTDSDDAELNLLGVEFDLPGISHGRRLEIVEEVTATEASTQRGRDVKVRVLRWLIGATGDYSPATVLALSLVRDMIGEAA